MIKVLFKSEELLIAADSESKVVSPQKIPQQSTSAILLQRMVKSMLIMLLTISKYVVAKQIKVTTKTEVVVKTAKSSVAAEDALRIADKFGLVQRELDNGATPLEALKEWDII